MRIPLPGWPHRGGPGSPAGSSRDWRGVPASTTRFRRPFRLACLSAALAAAGLLAFSIDLPTARRLASPKLRGEARQRHGPPGDVVRLINLCEVFGYSPTASVFLLAAWMLDPSLQTRDGRRRLAHLIGATFSGGLATDVLKLSVTRVRPYAADLAAHASPWETFLNTEAASGVAARSFPSGHAAVAAGLAVALCWQYPRGGPLFVALALGAAAQRVVSCSHYVSDVCFGGSLAVALAAAWILFADRADAAIGSGR